MKHVAIYCRVSTRRQDQRSQVPDLERWAASQSLPVVWYRDSASGKTMARPGWEKLQTALERGDVATVACWRLDRLGRTAKGLSTLFVDLQARGVGLVSLREGIDLGTPAGRMMAHVIASISQYETELRAERVLAGQAAAKLAGKTLGGRRPGTRVRVTIEKERAIKKMHRDGEAVASIARTVGLSRQSIYTVLAR